VITGDLGQSLRPLGPSSWHKVEACRWCLVSPTPFCKSPLCLTQLSSRLDECVQKRLTRQSGGVYHCPQLLTLLLGAPTHPQVSEFAVTNMSKGTREGLATGRALSLLGPGVGGASSQTGQNEDSQTPLCPQLTESVYHKEGLTSAFWLLNSREDGQKRDLTAAG
jgi:hypothetical protein